MASVSRPVLSTTLKAVTDQLGPVPNKVTSAPNVAANIKLEDIDMSSATRVMKKEDFLPVTRGYISTAQSTLFLGCNIVQNQ